MQDDHISDMIDRMAARLIRLSALKAPAFLFVGEAKQLMRIFGPIAAKEKREVEKWKRDRRKKGGK